MNPSTTSAPHRFGCNCNSSPCQCTAPRRTTTVFPDQRSVTEQLYDAINLCNKAGMYDAADWIRWAMSPVPSGQIGASDG